MDFKNNRGARKQWHLLMRSMVVYLTSHHLQAQSMMFITGNRPPDFSWLTVLIKKYVRIYHIGFSTFFFNIWHEQLGEKLLTMLERARLSLEQFVENDENIAL